MIMIIRILKDNNNKNDNNDNNDSNTQSRKPDSNFIAVSLAKPHQKERKFLNKERS
jgi:hypothetical protein